jgi:flagellar hook-associated protein 1 FlgK
MSSNLFSLLNTAKTGLLTHQVGMEVTGNNIANVETEGFSRQQISLATNTPRTIAQGQLGTGVLVAGIERIHDQFLFRQIVGEGDALGEFQARKDIFDQLEIIFNESLGQGLNSQLSDFFNSLQDLSSDPGNLAVRANLVSKAQSLASAFNNIGEQLFQVQRSIDVALKNEVQEINSLTLEIAQLNQEISTFEVGGRFANDQRDRRDLLIKQLSDKIDISLMDESDGQISITLSNGKPLVLRSHTFQLTIATNPDNNSFQDIFLSDGAGGATNITSAINGGSLRGLLDMRDVETESLLDKLNLLAAGITQEFNRVHQQGFGLNGSTGIDFFSPLTPTAVTDSNNTGAASLSVVNASPTTVSLDEFEIVFTSATEFDLFNLTTGSAEGSFIFADGVPFNLAGGLAVTITGVPAVGDRARFSVSEGAAENFAVSGDILANFDLIAAGLTLLGDGDNAVELAGLQNALVFDSITFNPGSGSFTIDEFYNAMVSQVGSRSFRAQAGLSQHQGTLLQLNNRQDSISGVSIDEELINMIKFQQAFNAAARVISVVDEMMNTLLNEI